MVFISYGTNAVETILKGKAESTFKWINTVVLDIEETEWHKQKYVILYILAGACFSLN